MTYSVCFFTSDTDDRYDSDAVDDSSRHGTVVVADLDLGRLAEVRAQLPSLANRRPSAYRWPTAPAGVDPEASPAPR